MYTSSSGGRLNYKILFLYIYLYRNENGDSPEN